MGTASANSIESPLSEPVKEQYFGEDSDGQRYIYIVDETQTISADNKNVIFTGYGTGHILFENYGTFKDLNSLTVENGAFNNGYQVRNMEGQEKGDGATIDITGKLTIASTKWNHNYGIINADSFEIT